MPDIKAHENQANHNIRFLNNFAGSCNDWSITVSFYSSLHVVEASIFNCSKIIYKTLTLNFKHTEDLKNYFRTHPKPLNHFDSEHAIRNVIVMETFQEIYDDYKNLYDNSRNARYSCQTITPVRVAICRGNLKTIADWAVKKHKVNITEKI
ncbi:MAG: hypothetical protein A2452_01125 [Candidatus Firestonebacteria bacterium RIFOXYC2_FULL_39_67]|nr:MAG: hypothetical protein A2536_11190 [Candidatus Firestonebacteria bacterium RIFOXYD2_FULL_39_29]OGF54080.1 MAG: hypothetical protein A2452_01125 [Candidatus Firestonebacteria bacterium RIFOXYC2_FULL_39_67]